MLWNSTLGNSLEVTQQQGNSLGQYKYRPLEGNALGVTQIQGNALGVTQIQGNALGVTQIQGNALGATPLHRALI